MCTGCCLAFANIPAKQLSHYHINTLAYYFSDFAQSKTFLRLLLTWFGLMVFLRMLFSWSAIFTNSPSRALLVAYFTRSVCTGLTKGILLYFVVICVQFLVAPILS